MRETGAVDSCVDSFAGADEQRRTNGSLSGEDGISLVARLERHNAAHAVVLQRICDDRVVHIEWATNICGAALCQWSHDCQNYGRHCRCQLSCIVGRAARRSFLVASSSLVPATSPSSSSRRKWKTGTRRRRCPNQRQRLCGRLPVRPFAVTVRCRRRRSRRSSLVRMASIALPIADWAGLDPTVDPQVVCSRLTSRRCDSWPSLSSLTRRLLAPRLCRLMHLSSGQRQINLSLLYSYGF